MTGEFSAACANYYRLTQRLNKLFRRCRTLTDNAIPYTGQTDATELDAIIACNRQVQEAYHKMVKTELELRKAEWVVVEMMYYFGIPANTRLQAVIPEEVAFDIWAGKDNKLYFVKTADLDPEVDNPNIIKIRLNDGSSVVEDGWE